MAAIAAAHPTEPPDGAGEGEETTPHLVLDGFRGPLERLLLLARAQRIDLARIPVERLVDQLAAALPLADRKTRLGQQGDWVVMAAWLLLLRSQLLLPAQPAAAAKAGHLQARLVALQHTQALADWLEQQPRLGHDVFARGQPELVGTAREPAPQADIVEFLWASLALFDDAPPPDPAAAWHLPPPRPSGVDAARARILLRLARAPEGAGLGDLLPEPEPIQAGSAAPPGRQRRSAWATTLAAGLELAKQGAVVLEQAGDFQPITVRLASIARCPPPAG